MPSAQERMKVGLRGLFPILFLLVLQSLAPIVTAGNGISTSASSGIGSTDTISNGFSSVSNIGNGYDSSSSSHARLIADGDFSGNFGSFCASQSTTAFAQILYTLDLQSSTNQSITVSLYSETEFSFGPGWSTVTDLEMSAQITDNGGTWTAWTSNTTNNSLSPSSSDITLGDITPRANGTIDVLMRIQHDGEFTSSCHAELLVYDFSSDATLAPSVSYAGSPFTFTKNTGIGTVSPTNTGGASTSWAITSGSLPSGLSLSPTTGAITGNPSAVSSTASITIEATNSGGSDSTTISITVEDAAPVISYAGSPFTFVNNSVFVEIIPENSGGESNNWRQIEGILPLGFILNGTTGIISGTPILAPTYVNLTIVASNAAGSDLFPLQFIINQDDNTMPNSKDTDDRRVFEYIISDPVEIIKVSSFLALWLLLLGYIILRLSNEKDDHKDLTEDEKSDLASRYNKLYWEKNDVVPDWDKVGEPQEVLSNLDTSLSAVFAASIPESEHLKKAKRNFKIMQIEINTPAAASPYLRSILTSILRAYREHLRMSLANSELNGKIKHIAAHAGRQILNDIQAGLATKEKSKNVYRKLLNAGIIEKETEDLIPELIKLMEKLNKAIHSEDSDSMILEEPGFIDAISILQKLLTSGFKDFGQ